MTVKKDGMSVTFVEQEKQNVKDKVEQEGLDAVARTVIFWAPSPGYKLGNFVKEAWSGGRITQRESPLSFMNHIKVADPDTDEGKEIIAFVEKSGAFQANIIRKCETMEEAMKLTSGWKVGRSIVEIECTDCTATQHTSK